MIWWACVLTKKKKKKKKAHGAVYIYNGRRIKFDGNGISVGRISHLIRFAQPPHSSGALRKQIEPPLTSLLGELRATHRQT